MITEAMVEAATEAARRAWLREEEWEDIARFALEAAERAAWQPIETAPKGRISDTVDLFAGARFPNCWYYKGEWQRHGSRGEICRVDSPTHWRPLPAPPLNDAPSSRG